MNNINPVNLPPQVFNLKGWIELTESSQLKTLFGEQLKNADFKVLNFSDHHFPLNGYTAFWLLAESHLALHTFTESGWCYIELSSCNKEKAQLFKAACEKLPHALKWDSDVEELSCETNNNVHS
ncbi:S-adenosylmethionine decarboxylase family protein [Carboxylicivirga sp. N1Y90]|uniref:S-adenosylmethionine decarboxylase family protein n=1 Tax=Carboxylicivirga fragile TaxID=3417571 RepID=UPI003D3576A1|nr:S-adenosylmethionine decarboxylase [Marinilabiliaceae bacterium N1Y90]